MTPTRLIELDPADWIAARWKAWSPLPRPMPSSFNEAACRDRVLRFSKWGQSEYLDPDPFKRLKIPRSMTLEEADFWFRLLNQVDENTSPARALAKLNRSTTPRMLTPAEARQLQGRWTRYRCEVVRVLSFLMTPADLLSLLSCETKGVKARWAALAFQKFVLVHLPQTEIDRLRDAFAPRIFRGIAEPPPPQSPLLTDPADYFPSEVCFGAVLGCHEEIAHVIADLTPESFQNGCGTYTYAPMEIVFGLSGADAIVAAQRRLGFGIQIMHNFRSWLATTELRALDVIRDGIRGYNNSKWHRDYGMKALACVKAPEVAELMLEFSLEPKYAAIATDWLETEVGNAVTGLIPVAAGCGPLAVRAKEYLGRCRQRGYGDVIDAAM